MSTRTPRSDDLLEGARRAQLVLRARQLRVGGASWQEVGGTLGVAHQTLFKWAQKVEGLPNHEVTAETCAPRHFASGRRPQTQLPASEAERIRQLVGQTNLTWNSGSLPVALNEAMRRGELSEETAALIRGRVAAGMPPLPRSQARQLRVGETAIRALRSPRNAWLDYVQSPGSLMLTRDDEGNERYVEPGEWFTLDDGSINLGCWVPDLQRPGDKCWERYGVVVGRFQFLLCVDHRSYFIPGFGFTCRPRDSYRAEDLTATMHNVFAEHGLPKAMVLEHGVSAANLVTRTLRAAGVDIIRASSPHQKVVEMVFDKLWTRLSLLGGQVGRTRGEEEEIAKLYQACRTGTRDPRTVFCSLRDVLDALKLHIGEWNAHRVNSDRYGSWIPAEMFAAHGPNQLRPFHPEDAWLFSPVATDPLTVQGATVETSVRLLPEISTKFVFGADWLSEYHGSKVHLHFNPLAGECDATAVLAEAVGDRPAGRVIGRLAQIDAIARRTRRVLGYGLDPDIGRTEAAAAGRALRRSAQAIRPDGRAGRRVEEVRTADGAVRTITTAGAGDGIEGAVEVDPSIATPTVAAEPRRTRSTPAAAVPQPESTRTVEAPFSRRRFSDDDDDAILAPANQLEALNNQ